MIDKLVALDTELLLYLNGYHVSWLDHIVLFLTETFAWLPLYFLLLYHIFKTYRNKSWMVLLGIVVTIVLADQITTSFMKPYFARLRPSREPSLASQIHLVDGYIGGLYGFASSHAANTFGTATFFWLVFRESKRWMLWLFPWAVILTYTRIYLGVHYPGDIIAGAVVGVFSGWTGYILFHRLTLWDNKRSMSINP